MTKKLKVNLAIVASAIALGIGGTWGVLTVAKRPVDTAKLNSQIFRYQNDEVLCYLYLKGGLSCVWKAPTKKASKKGK